MTSSNEDLRRDRPTAHELLEIIAETLADVVVPATEPHARHQARVAANLCATVARELSSNPASMPDLPANLVSVDDAEARAALATVQELVRDKLSVVKPGYDTHDASAEDDVIS